MDLILASGSLWRRRLLKKRGYTFNTMVTDFDEIKKGENPSYVALYNAFGKAMQAAKTVRESLENKTKKSKKNVAKKMPKTIVIGVDTIGVLGKKILGKPKDRADAKKMLLSLSQKAHQVISGLVLCDVGTGKTVSSVVTTDVVFRKIESDELEKYLDSNQWVGKAGSYAIQGRAKGFVAKILGDKTNIVGLPIDELEILLKIIKTNKIPT